MSIFQIIVKTIISTIDILLSIAVLKAENTTDTMVRTFLLLIILNLAGVWI